MTKGRGVVGIGGAIAVLCFFLPWVLVSCNETPVARWSGWDMATGPAIHTVFGEQPAGESYPALFVVPAGGIVCAVLALLGYRRRLALRAGALAAIGAAAASLLVLVIQFAKLGSQAANQESMSIISGKTQAGLWGTVAAFLVVILGGVLDLVAARRERPPQGAAPPGDASVQDGQT